MSNGLYFIIIWNLLFSGASQDLQHIHYFIMDPEFGFVDNHMAQMMGGLYQMINTFKGNLGTPTFTEAMIGPYKAKFVNNMTQDIK